MNPEHAEREGDGRLGLSRSTAGSIPLQQQVPVTLWGAIQEKLQKIFKESVEYTSLQLINYMVSRCRGIAIS
jgi:hypothetical protein